MTLYDRQNFESFVAVGEDYTASVCIGVGGGGGGKRGNCSSI